MALRIGLSEKRGFLIKRRRFPKIFFGWWTVLAGGIINFWGLGYHLYGISAVFKPIASELGFSRAATSVAVAITRLLSGIEGPLTGVLTDRFGPKWVTFFGVFLLGLGLILTYSINSLWTFYIAWGVIMGTGGNIALMIPLDKAIGDWFVKKRGLASSIQIGISGLSGALVLPPCCLADNYPRLADDLRYRRSSYAAGWLTHYLVLLETTPTGVLRVTP